MVLAALEWGLSHMEARRHKGLSPVSWVRRFGSLRDLRVLCQECLVKQAWSTLLLSPTFVNGLVSWRRGRP